MSFKLTKKRVTIALIFVFVLFVLLEGFYLWKSYDEKYGTWKKSYPNFDSFKVVETPDGKIIENKKEGFSAKVPTGWVVKLYGDEVDVLSPEVEFGEHGEPTFNSMKKACGMDIQIEKYENISPDFKDTVGVGRVRTLIKRVQEKPDGIVDGQRYQVMEIGSHQALKTFGSGGKNIFIEVPIADRIYSFHTYLFLEKCGQEFDDFLKTVSIK